MVFLERLLKTNSPSGYEKQAAEIFCNYLREYCTDVYTDIMCNSIAVINPDSDFKIMLDAHYDEIGMQVIHIDNNGHISFRRNGGLDIATLPGSEVIIINRKQEVAGVVGKKTLHLQKPDELKKGVEIEDLWIDIGVSSKEEALELIDIGDPISIKPNFSFMGENRIKSKGLDDKIGVYIIAEVIKRLSQENLKIGIYGVASAQEELGGRGATVGTYSISPNVAFCIDVGFATDIPTISERNISKMSLGRGIGICHSADNTPELVNILKDTAKKHSIPYQDNVPMSASGGNNTSRVQLVRYGVATALLSVPNRYMHTSVEMCDMTDVNSAIELLVKTILLFNDNPTLSLLST